MTALEIAVAVAVGALVLLLGYGVAAYVVLFYLLGNDRLGSGIAVDIAYAFALPFLLAVAWLRTVRGP